MIRRPPRLRSTKGPQHLLGPGSRCWFGDAIRRGPIPTVLVAEVQSAEDLVDNRERPGEVLVEVARVGGVSGSVRELAESFDVRGYERVRVLEWQGEGARIGINFSKELDDNSSACRNLAAALATLPAWEFQTLPGTPIGKPPCDFAGRSNGHYVTAGVSDDSGRPVIFVGFWDD